MNYINEHLNKEKDGINITLFNQSQKHLEFYLTSNKNQKYELELYSYYGPKKLKCEFIENISKIQELKELKNKTFTYLSDFFKKIDEIYKS
jgi:hypothetical protein